MRPRCKTKLLVQCLPNTCVDAADERKHNDTEEEQGGKEPILRAVEHGPGETADVSKYFNERLPDAPAANVVKRAVSSER